MNSFERACDKKNPGLSLILHFQTNAKIATLILSSCDESEPVVTSQMNETMKGADKRTAVCPNLSLSLKMNAYQVFLE